ncbi:heavy-metal-associated domain-containing protein, partial [Halolamina salina]
MTADDSDDPRAPPDGGESLELDVPEMDCPSCAGKVESSVRELDAVDGVDPQITTGTVTVNYDPEKTSPEDVADRIEQAGYAVESGVGETTETFTAPEMDCASCAGKVENAVGAVDGVTAYQTQPTTGKITVTFNREQTTAEAITRAVENAGYEVTESTADGD